MASSFFRIREGIAGVLVLVAQLLMTGYVLLSLYLFAVNLGGGWLIGAIIFFPLAFFYPLISVWQLGVFPAGVAAIGVGALVIGTVGSWLLNE